MCSARVRPFARDVQLFDSTIGWRFVNRIIKEQYGVDSMPETAENLAADYNIARADQDIFAQNSQQRVAQAVAAGHYKDEIMPVVIPQRKGADLIIDKDEHPRPESTIEELTKLKAPFRVNGSVTAGNSSGVNDGACALLIASGAAAQQYGLTPKARIVAMATAGVPPRVMGIGPVPATHKVLALSGLRLDQMDVIELNEAFAVQALAVLRDLGLPHDAPHVNPNGGAIALGHPWV